MLAVVIVLGILIYQSSATGMQSLSGAYAAAMTIDQSAVAQHFEVEQVVYHSSGADLYVRNTGSIPATVVAVYVSDQTTESFVTSATIGVTVGVESYVEIPYTTLSFTPTVGQTYTYTVTSSLGNSVIYVSEDA